MTFGLAFMICMESGNTRQQQALHQSNLCSSTTAACSSSSSSSHGNVGSHLGPAAAGVQHLLQGQVVVMLQP
jgi:hypothetical protein